MRSPRIFAVCDGPSLGKTTLARLIHNVLPSPGSSLICLGTCRQQVPFLDSPLRSAYFDVAASDALSQLSQIIRHHRVVVLDVETAKHDQAQTLLNDPMVLGELEALQTHAIRLSPDHHSSTLRVQRPLVDSTGWERETQQVALPTLPRGIADSLQECQLSLPEALGEQRAQLEHRVAEWLSLWEKLCAPVLLTLLDRVGQPEQRQMPMANAV